MKTTKIKSKTLYIYAGIIIIAGLVYWFYYKKDKYKIGDTTSLGSGSGSGKTNNNVVPETEEKLFKDQPVEPIPTPTPVPKVKRTTKKIITPTTYDTGESPFVNSTNVSNKMFAKSLN